MKRFIGIYILLALCLLTSIFLILPINSLPKAEELNLVKVNRLAHLVKQHLNHPEELEQYSFDYDFILLSNEEQIIFKSRNDLPNAKIKALQTGMVTWELSENEIALGTIMLEITPITRWNQLQKDYQLKVSLLFFSLLLILGISFLYLYMKIIYPFIKLKKFAAKITTGQLEEPLPMDRHNLFGAFTESFDVMRTALLEARQQAIAIDKSKKELIASLSHDIKTPVTSARLVLELLQLKYPDDSYLMQKLSTIQDKTEQIEQLTNNLLHSTLEELEELTVLPVSESSHTLLTLLKKADIDEILDCDQIPSCMIELDLSRTQQVLENIISNSRKYAGTSIRISSHIEGGFLHFKLEDSGEHLNSEEIELVCDKYYRGEHAIVSGKEGEGIGLYLARNMMRKMNGDLEVYDCRPGFGVRLLFLLS